MRSNEAIQIQMRTVAKEAEKYRSKLKEKLDELREEMADQLDELRSKLEDTMTVSSLLNFEWYTRYAACSCDQWNWSIRLSNSDSEM